MGFSLSGRVMLGGGAGAEWGTSAGPHSTGLLSILVLNALLYAPLFFSRCVTEDMEWEYSP